MPKFRAFIKKDKRAIPQMAAIGWLFIPKCYKVYLSYSECNANL